MNNQLPINQKKIIYKKAKKLIDMYKKGLLGGEVMPEDANPGLSKDSKENCLYFTLPMALNYQRNSYKLWEAAKATYEDVETTDVFDPKAVTQMSEGELKNRLVKYKVALQPNKHPEIWRKLCATLCDDFDGDIRNLFIKNDNSVEKIKEYIVGNKKKFPYLSGPKILNYWLYVMTQYTAIDLAGREYITVAPDTHVIQASIKLGLIKDEDKSRADIGLNKNRDINFLSAAARYCNEHDIVLTLLANEFCGNGITESDEIKGATGCIFRDHCYQLHSAGYQKETKLHKDYPMGMCIASRKSKSVWLKMNYIRPEDVKRYNEIGIDHFKLTGRTGSTAHLQEIMRAYMKESYDGNLLGLWKHLETIKEEKEESFRPQVYIDNKKLDGFVDYWFENRNHICANEICGETCKYCDLFIKRANI